MPNRWPIANGNWSDAAIWSGSIIPTASDDVYANSKSVIIDQNVIVNSFRSSIISGVAQGGQFIISGSYVVSASSLISNGFDSVNVTGLIGLTGSSLNNATVIITSVTNTFYAFTNNSDGILNIVAPNMTHTPGNPGQAVRNNLDGIINYIGNINVPSTTWSNGRTFQNSRFGIINFTGNLILSSSVAGANTGIYNIGNGNINVVGNIQSGGSTTFGIDILGIGIVNMTGNMTANGAAGINSTSAGIINVIGQLIASPTSNAVSSTSTTATNIFSGPFINSGSRNAIYCYNVRLYDDNTTRYTIGVSGSTDTISLLSPDQVTGVPSGSNVRAGILFGPGNELTGSMYVPDPRSVSIGVAVDNTTGSAIVKPEDLWNYAVTAMTASNSIGQRLASTSTSASSAAIVSSFSS